MFKFIPIIIMTMTNVVQAQTAQFKQIDENSGIIIIFNEATFSTDNLDITPDPFVVTTPFGEVGILYERVTNNLCRGFDCPDYATITSLPDGFIGTLQKLEIQEESFGVLRIERWLGV